MEIRPPNTRELVAQAADELLFEGARPTVANVRERIGRGSAGTINTALRDWWLSLADRLVQAESRPELPDSLVEPMNELWDAALGHARQNLDTHWKEAEQKVAEAQNRADTALFAQEQSDKRSEQLERRIGELDAQRLELERRLGGETNLRKVAEGRIAEVRAEAERALESSRTLLSRLEKETQDATIRAADTEARLHQDIDREREAVRRLEARLEKQAQASREQDGALRHQLLDSIAESTRTKTESRLLANQITELGAEVKQLTRDKEVLAAREATLKERLAGLSERYFDQQNKVHRLEKQIQELENADTTVRAPNDNAQDSVG